MGRYSEVVIWIGGRMKWVNKQKAITLKLGKRGLRNSKIREKRVTVLMYCTFTQGDLSTYTVSSLYLF